jgi:hypothetical protein
VSVGEDNISKVRTMLATSGWAEVVKPGLLRLRDNALVTLIQPARKDGPSDEYVKGQVNALSWMVGWDARVEQIAAELTGQPPAVEEEAVGTIYGPDGEPAVAQ